MDLSKFKTSDWMKVGGAAGFFIFGFFSWVKISYSGDLGFAGSAGGGNVFDFFFTGIIPWLLVIATGVLTVLVLMNVVPDNPRWPLVMLAATGLAAVLLLIRLIFNPIDGSGGLDGFVEVGRGFGLILSVLSGLVAFAGAVLGFKEAGGDFNDLKDVNKLKSTLGVASTGGGATPPPPPPPGGMSPPPPPPPPTAG